MKLVEFLLKAKKNTYANPDVQPSANDDAGTKKYVYEKGKWRYEDEYEDYEPFRGKEVVTYDGTTVWRMEYNGKSDLDVFPGMLSTKMIYTFLRKALMQVAEDLPYRGPAKFEDKDSPDFVYVNEVMPGSNVINFAGQEYITYKGKEVYRLNYTGEGRP